MTPIGSQNEYLVEHSWWNCLRSIRRCGLVEGGEGVEVSKGLWYLLYLLFLCLMLVSQLVSSQLFLLSCLCSAIRAKGLQPSETISSKVNVFLYKLSWL